ncbi:acetate--CoA ligase family protein [Spongiactinospora sp. TRM90649]|uniref:acetate--CoA ligase family protein n=1 Tax=Spongiactinospora sp. TRM90649 TaxID=3031114 RepID=UPI0023F93D29|nr:acetate--CoA ligase family protein [Spongiactinospora sp. TRM90649]MDF5754833.1 acetate--CoA ligase family protein [Spongiactinospora sp. TRM90649]
MSTEPIGPDRTYRQPALADLLNPKSIVIVGLSARPGSTGMRILANLQRSGFGGTVYGVHRSGEDVEGVPVYRTLADVPEIPTVALLCTPGETVPELVEQAGRKGCRGAVVYASGFEETADGAARAARLRESAARHGMSVVGPNCLGLFNPGRDLWLTAADFGTDLRPGPVAVVSQSGSGCILLAGSGRLRFSYVVSSGNGTVTGLADYLDHFVQDPATRAVGVVVEGLSDAEGVLAAVRKGHDNGVAVVALKVGRTELGARNVASHTGAIAGDARAYEAFCRRAGIVTVTDYDELTEALVALSTIRTAPAGDRVAFLGLSGGEIGLIADVAADFGAHRDGGAVRLAELSPGTREELARILPEFATIANPLDGTGQLVGDPERFGRLAAAVAGDRAVDLLAVVLDAPPSLGERLAGSYGRLLATLPGVREGSGTPVMVLSNYGGGLHPFTERALAGSDIPVVHGTRAGMAAVAAVTAGRGRAPGTAEAHEARPESLSAVRRALSASPSGQVSHDVLAELAERYDLPLPRRIAADTAAGAVAAAESIGFPVVLKTASPKVVHKSDVGGVAVGLATPERVREAYEAVTSSVAGHLGEAAPQVVLEEMVTGGVEAFVGCGLDPVFGQVLALGAGGTLVELQPDPALSLLPVSSEEVRRMVAGTPLARLFAGYRGAPPADAEAFAGLVQRVARLAADLRVAEVEIDLNPVAVLPRGQGVRVLDLRIVAAAGPRVPDSQTPADQE